MRRTVYLWVYTVAMLIGGNPFVNAAELYRLDPDHTSIVFRVKHLNVAYVFGSFYKSSGMIRIEENDPSRSTIEMQVMADSVSTHVDKRDKHLRSPDFFDIKKYPTISFKSRSVKPIDDSSYKVSGELTLLGKTRPLVVTVSETGSGKDPWGKFRKGFKTPVQ